MSNEGNPSVLEARGLSKAFPGVQALSGVDLTVKKGMVHALMGENGAGKSTLMKILAGLEQPDTGEILFERIPVRISNPHVAQRLGISMIHQELMPFPELSVAENVFMGHETGTGFAGWVQAKNLESSAGQILQRLGVSVHPRQKMKHLSVASMQMVEIARAIARSAKVLIMDEPTSSLSGREVEALLRLVSDLRMQGVSILYCSHKLEEVFAIADTITVFRDGRHIATAPKRELSRELLIHQMVGRDLLQQKTRGDKRGGSATTMSVHGLSRSGRFRDISFDLHRGEILGITGLMGAGRTEVLHALFGMPPAESGEIKINGKATRISSPAGAIESGIALLSEDRQRYGLIPTMSVKENLTLSNLRDYCSMGFIQHEAEQAIARSQVELLGVKTAGIQQPVRFLSGGNQQKVLLGRVLLTEPEILLLDEPTRGIDIGAKAEIYELIGKLAEQGKSVLLVSSELPEVMALAHRILVMREGELVAELDPATTTQQQIMSYAMPT